MDPLGGLVYSIPRSLIELGRFTPTALDQFVTPMNVRQPSTCYFDHCNIFLVYKFCPSLTDKILKKKDLMQNFHIKFCYFPFPCSTLFIAGLCQTAKQCSQKHFVLYVGMFYTFFVFKLFKKQKTSTHRPVVWRENTVLLSQRTPFQLLDI